MRHGNAVDVPLATLNVERFPGVIRYHLETGGPIQEVVPHAIADAEIASLQEMAFRILHAGSSRTSRTDLLATGRLLCSALVPERVRREVDALQAPLLVSTSLQGIPLELLATDDFWGIRHAVGRRVLVDRTTRPIQPRRPRSRPRALVIASDPRGDLPLVNDEADEMFRALAPVADVYVLAGSEACFDAVVRRLGDPDGFDLIHYCGHVVRDGVGTSGLLLAEERLLSGTVIERTLTGSPIVFLNGCATGRSDIATQQRLWDEDVTSITYGFLLGGARAVIGTVTDVADAIAAAIAKELWRRLLDGSTLGEALRDARVRGRALDPDSPSWLAFVLYGDPTVRLAEPSLAPSIPSPPVAAPSTDPSPVTSGSDTVVRPHRRGRRAWVIAAVVATIVMTAVAVWMLGPPKRELRIRIRAYFAALRGTVDEPSRRALVDAAEYFTNHDRFADSLWFRTKALEVTERLQGPASRNAAVQRQNLGHAYLQLDEPDRALQLLQEALPVLEGTEERPANLALARSNLGRAYEATGSPRQGMREYRRALRLHRQLPKNIRAIVFNNLGDVERHRGRMVSARKWYQRTLRMYGAASCTKVDECVNAISDMCLLEADRRVQRFDQAEAACRQALDAQRAHHPVGHPQRARAKHNLVEVLRLQNRHGDAQQLLEEAD